MDNETFYELADQRAYVLVLTALNIELIRILFANQDQDEIENFLQRLERSLVSLRVDPGSSDPDVGRGAAFVQSRIPNHAMRIVEQIRTNRRPN